jgi:hypothetical protein
MDLARAPCRAPLTARKMGSGYENESYIEFSRCLVFSEFVFYFRQTRPQSLLNTRAGARPEVPPLVLIYIYGYIPIRPYKIEIQITTGDESVF